jgi:hypothetical protein
LKRAALERMASREGQPTRRPESSNGKSLWGQRRRSETDRYAEDPRRGAHAAPHRKIASGGRTQVRPRSLEKRPREMKTQEGTRMTVGRTRPSDIADSGLEHDPEVDATIAGAGQPAGERR